MCYGAHTIVLWFYGAMVVLCELNLTGTMALCYYGIALVLWYYIMQYYYVLCSYVLCIIVLCFNSVPMVL